ncbi:GspE/PulE family protein [Legionella oakridgensis]|uniref:Pilus MSHA type biogenesis protein n=2 Tax=Legionella oakridgensis TaxID=29423 RepID=W0BI57_9GAMM|nr:GspE/PulE family protein [Legionella oakridgensis]AHE68376.1 pilus MSHA type biogenesis protein [Legionella oakridgensis ATCC 33761 = DSM 21215]KTD38955.1 type II protein secretion ATPase LspE [Legionella oakridgensis]STY21317.1 type II protein secretion ATPase LspE [Legionella longbeachae]
MKRIRLGELLLKENLVTQATLDKASELQKQTGNKFGRILIEMGVVKEEELLKLLARQLDIPYIDLNFYEINSSLATLLPETYARRYRALVLERINKELLVGMADPLDINAFDAVSKILKQPIKMAVISESALLAAIDRIYRRTQEISHFAEELSGEMVEERTEKEDELFDETIESEEQAPVVKLLNSLFRDAVQARASDIHIEPDEKSLRIRLRIDGVLNESILENKRILNALIQRLKLRAHLDISEKRIPQDGRFNFTIKGRSFDVRVSTMPTSYGESVVMRLLDQSTPVSDLSDLGISADMVKRLEAIYKRPYGMLLVTGPTGSGKTTTLYSILSRLNTPDRKILTVEDPVEYRISRVCQVQVNPKIDLTFARVLRSILRQDPDIIMVGEIRDSETARIAMRAAITGHFVLATLHTNDAISSAMRLIDMGAEGYMVAAAVKAIIGQRLVRTICQACIKDHKADAAEKIWLESMGVDASLVFKIGEGCTHCNYRGYVGRIGVYELLEMNMEMLNALRLNNAAAFTKAALACQSYEPLSRQVTALIKSGETTIHEGMRVIGQLDEEFKYREIDLDKEALQGAGLN